MFHKFKFLIGFILLVLTIAGCVDRPQKTDSMVYRDTIIAAAQIPISKAEVLLSDKVRKNPIDHLDHLIIAKNAMSEAIKTYQKGKIGSYNDIKIESMQRYFDDLNPILHNYAKSLLIDVVEKTTQLRNQIEEAKNQPYSARDNDTSQLVKFLGGKYNKDVKDCCLNKLSQVDQLLKSNAGQYRELLVLIRSINSELGKVIQQKNYAKALLNRINAL